jgi:hypothetical protein
MWLILEKTKLSLFTFLHAVLFHGNEEETKDSKYPCSAQTRTGIGLLGKPPAVKQFPTVESHLGVRASYATPAQMQV